MTGIESITGKIRSDCRLQIDKITAETDETIQIIMAQAAEAAKEKAEKIAAAAQEKAKRETELAENAAKLQLRNSLLAAKRDEIAKTLAMALDKACALPDEAYFNLIYQTAEKTRGRSGKILLNEKDLKRLPKDFEAQMRRRGICGTVCSQPAPILAGFILKDGDIEENAAFEVLFADNRDMLEDLVNSSLFGE